MKKLNPLTADIALLGVAIVWGATFVVVKNAIEIVPVYQFLVIRFLISFLLLFPAVFTSLKSITAKEIKYGVILGVFLFMGYAFQTIGLQYTSASKAGFITGMAVVLVPIFSWMLFNEVPGKIVIFGTFLAFLGLGLLSLQGSLNIEYGDLLVLGCAVSFAFHITYVSKFAGQGRTTILTIIQIAMVALLSLPFSIMQEGWPRIYWTTDLLTAIIITGLFATTIAFFLQTYMQRFTSAAHTALIFSTEPVFAALFAYLLIGEILSPRGILGGALILLGMLISETSNMSWTGELDKLKKLKLNRGE